MPAGWICRRERPRPSARCCHFVPHALAGVNNILASRAVAYGKGQFKGAEKRMVDLGRAMNSAELALLRPRPFGLDEAACLLGNDFGCVNTSAAVLVAIDRPLDAEWLSSVQDWTRQQAREYLETHWHDGKPVQQILFEGRHFIQDRGGPDASGEVTACRDVACPQHGELGRIHRPAEIDHALFHVLELAFSVRHRATREHVLGNG